MKECLCGMRLRYRVQAFGLFLRLYLSFIKCNEHPVYVVLLFHLNSLPLLL